jgi:hypothetical protein
LDGEQNDVHNRINILGQFLNKQIPWYAEQRANVTKGVEGGWIKPDLAEKMVAQHDKAAQKQLDKIEALRSEADAILNPEKTGSNTPAGAETGVTREAVES